MYYREDEEKSKYRIYIAREYMYTNNNTRNDQSLYDDIPVAFVLFHKERRDSE
jgi:hypothetical protein